MRRHCFQNLTAIFGVCEAGPEQLVNDPCTPHLHALIFIAEEFSRPSDPSSVGNHPKQLDG